MARLIRQDRELIISKLVDILKGSTDLGTKITHNENFKDNSEFNFIIYGELFINEFYRLNNESYLFELQEIYAQDQGQLSIYIKYIGA